MLALALVLSVHAAAQADTGAPAEDAAPADAAPADAAAPPAAEPAPAASSSGASPVAPATAPNIWGQTGVNQATSARVLGNGVLDFSASGFGMFVDDYIVAGEDTNFLLGGHLTLSAAFLDTFELSLAARAASNANVLQAPNQFAVGDLYPSFKMGFTFLPVAVGIDVRGHLPTRIDAAGYDLGNYAVTTQGLFTLDVDVVRVHLNGGYVFQGGKYIQGDLGFFEQNPNFYNGVDGALLAVATNNWFYDSVTGGLALEVALPYVTPFVDVGYRAAVGVVDGRGFGGGAYDFVNDGHLTVSPGVRIGLGNFTVDVAGDIGVLGTGGADINAARIVEGQPLNLPYLVRLGITSTFDPTAAPGTPIVTGGGAPRLGQVKGCVVDGAGRPIPDAVVEGAALAGARLVSDEAGCFLTPPIAEGDVQLTVSRAGYESAPLAASVQNGGIAEAKVTLGGGNGAPPSSARGGSGSVVGYITNKEDETIEADLEVWDATGVKAAGKSTGGAYEVQAAAGEVSVVAKSEGYLAEGATVVVEPGARARANIALKKMPKGGPKAVLAKDRITSPAKVPFEAKKPRLQSTAVYALDDVVDVLLRNQSLRVRVEAYAEPLATPDESQKLADERAAAVVDYLVSHGVARRRLDMKGITLPESDKNRRVEFMIAP